MEAESVTPPSLDVLQQMMNPNSTLSMPSMYDHNEAQSDPELYRGGINEDDIALVVSIESNAMSRMDGDVWEKWRHFDMYRGLQVVQWTMMVCSTT
jgi:hypothetical protein